MNIAAVCTAPGSHGSGRRSSTLDRRDRETAAGPRPGRIDSYAEGPIDKQEFEPRITPAAAAPHRRLRSRPQQLQDEAALHTELRLIIGRLENFAAQVHNGLAAADWTSKRELIGALVKRVEVTQEQVNVAFRVDQHRQSLTRKKKFATS